MQLDPSNPTSGFNSAPALIDMGCCAGLHIDTLCLSISEVLPNLMEDERQITADAIVRKAQLELSVSFIQLRRHLQKRKVVISFSDTQLHLLAKKCLRCSSQPLLSR